MREFFRRIAGRARIGTCVAVAVCAPLAVRAQLAVSNFEIFLHTTAPAVSGTFVVRNVSNLPQTAQLHLGDWERREDGTNIYHDSTGVLPGSCGPTLTAFPMTLRLAPGQSQAVRVTYTGPARSTSCWEIVYVGTAPQPSRDTTGSRLDVRLQQGIKIYVEPAAANPELRIDSLALVPRQPATPAAAGDTTGHDVLATVLNTGVIQAKVHGRVEYRTLSDSVVARDSIAEFPVLPGARRSVRVPMAPLTPGHYVVLVILDYGGRDLLAAQLQVDVNQ
ncbi:MAG TPA: hypothetical protein VFK16_08485 [Gemmatimonadaceae bacterium]|nr:hypothetical protein [Gemmatimonadaceae bacterium]